MNNLQLIASLSLYILSVVAALVLAVTSKGSGQRRIKPLLIAHLLVFTIFFVLYLSAAAAIYIQSAFLLFFCSGIWIAGVVIRSSERIFLKIYSALFLFSVLIFLVSPSRTVRFITFNWQPSASSKMKLSGNYFLEEEQLLLARPDSLVTYKITRQFGIFHKTLARNISFGTRVDSLSVLHFQPDSAVQLRAYYIKKSDIFESCDSIDISVPFDALKNTIVQKREHH
jgi:hypothetical protein